MLPITACLKNTQLTVHAFIHIAIHIFTGISRMKNGDNYCHCRNTCDFFEMQCDKRLSPDWFMKVDVYASCSFRKWMTCIRKAICDYWKLQYRLWCLDIVLLDSNNWRNCQKLNDENIKIRWNISFILLLKHQRVCLTM